MKEALIFIAIGIIFLVVSYLLQGIFLRIGEIYFAILSIVYLVGTYAFFAIMRQLEIVLQDRGIYLEFGHADLYLISFLAICLMIALLNVAVAMVRRFRKNR